MAITIAAFLLLVLINSRRLTFVWEEWFHLRAISESLISGVLWGPPGYLAPLGNGLYVLEVLVFRSWYSGYVAVNALLLVVGILAVYTSVQRQWRGYVVASALVFLFSAGTLFTVSFGNEVSDTLALMFGGLAVRAWFARGSAKMLSVWLCFSAFSSNLTGIVVSTSVLAAVAGIELRGGFQGSWQRWLKRWILAAIAPAAVALGSTGIWFFMSETLGSESAAGLGSLQVTQGVAPLALLGEVVSVIMYWSVSVVIPGLLALPNFYLDWLMEISAHQLAFIGVTLAGAISISAFCVMDGSRRRSAARLAEFCAPWIVALGGAALLSAQLALFRGGFAQDLRFTMFWLPSVLVALALLVGMGGRRRLTTLWRATVLLLAVAGLTSAAVFAWRPSSAIDMVRPRTELSQQLLHELQRCPAGEATPTSRAIASGTPWSDLCQVYEGLLD